MAHAIYPIGYPDSINQNESTEVHFQNSDGSIWKRTGHCSRCGNCCDDPVNIFSEFDGNGDPNPLVPVVEGKCAYFRWSEDGLAMCLGRDTKYYNNGCKYQPSVKEHIVEWTDCTYKFEKME
tara:strand:+ start:677 stop:1042 length:366 start_codon:yes stop_codon:yes gene_type:complete